MSEPLLVPRGGGEVVGDSANRRVEILSDDESLHATWSRFGPRRQGADLHVHRRHTDLFYVLEGELTLGLGIEDEPVAVAPGTLARVPPLVVHGFRNGSDAEVRYLNFHAPGRGFADFLRALRDGRTYSYDQHPPPADGGRPPTDAVVDGAAFVSERPGVRAALLAGVDEIGIAEVRSDSGGPCPPPHLHRRHVESVYVLEGALAFTVGGAGLRAQAGSWVQVPRGVPHTFAQAGDGPVRFLEVHTPSCGFGAFVRGLGGARTDADLAAVRAAFDQVPAQPPARADPGRPDVHSHG
ncbi:MAG TPA: cupin domain-containing protein [Gaiellaceae bacterium]|nr:cupin domain-containing protein [Gaiellaceae bacterium]